MREEEASLKKVIIAALSIVCAVLIFGMVSTADARGVDRIERYDRHERVRTHLEALFERFEKRREARLEVICKQFIDDDDVEDSSKDDNTEDDDSEQEPEPEPEPEGDAKLLITEVLYDLRNDGSQGSETGGDNEWVELYNAGDAPIDIAGFVIGETPENGDSISESSLVIPAGGFLVVTDSETTADFWDFSSVEVVYLGSSISGGLSNSGDVVKVFTETGELVDAVSYGNNTDAFDPAVAGVTHGSSIARSSLSGDTDTAADWVENATPNPGS